MEGGASKKIKNAHKDINSAFYSKLIRKYPIIEESAKIYENHLNVKRQNL